MGPGVGESEDFTDGDAEGLEVGGLVGPPVGA